jgi:hypothetical protein
MTETYTRDSDGKRFKKIIIGKGFSDETEICYLERIEENPMPEIKFGDIIEYRSELAQSAVRWVVCSDPDSTGYFQYANGKEYCELNGWTVSKFCKASGAKLFRNGALLWEAKK